MRDGGGDEDGDCDELVGGSEGGRGREEDVGEVDDGERAEGEGVFGVGDCGDEVWGSVSWDSSSSIRPAEM